MVWRSRLVPTRCEWNAGGSALANGLMIFKAAGAIVAVLFVAVAVGMWQGFIPFPGPALDLLAGATEPEH